MSKNGYPGVDLAYEVSKDELSRRLKDGGFLSAGTLLMDRARMMAGRLEYLGIKQSKEVLCQDQCATWPHHWRRIRS